MSSLTSSSGEYASSIGVSGSGKEEVIASRDEDGVEDDDDSEKLLDVLFLLRFLGIEY